MLHATDEARQVSMRTPAPGPGAISSDAGRPAS